MNLLKPIEKKYWENYLHTLPEEIVIHKFKDVPLEIAIVEGEGDLSLD